MNYIMLMFFQKAIVLREHLKCVDVFYRFLMQRIGRPRIRSHEGFAKATLQNVSKPSPEGGSGTPYTFSSCWPGYIDPENHLVDTNLPTLFGRVYVNLRDGICDYSYFYYYIYIYICVCFCVYDHASIKNSYQKCVIIHMDVGHEAARWHAPKFTNSARQR